MKQNRDREWGKYCYQQLLMLFFDATGTSEMLLIAKIIGVFSTILVLLNHESHTGEQFNQHKTVET